MSVLDGESKAPLPSMAWSSVVPEASERQSGHDSPDRDAAPESDLDSTVAERTEGTDSSGSMSFGEPDAERVKLDVTPPSVLSAGAPPLGLDVGHPPVSSPGLSSIPASTFDRSSEPDPAPPAAPPFSAPLLSPAPNVSSSSPAAPPAQPPAVTAAPPAPTAPSASTVPPASTFSPVKIDVPRMMPPSTSPQGELPTIVEATPVAPLANDAAPAASTHSGELTAVQSGGLSSDAMTTGEMPATAVSATAMPATGVPAPAVPSVPAAPAAPSPAMSLPAQLAATHLTNPHAYGSMPTTTRPQKRSSGGSGFGLVLALIVLAGLIAGGLVFGREYLFPEEWDESARAYADDIEAIRGVDFVEPLLIVSEPTADYRARVGDELLGTWEQSLPMWRSFGLAAGGTDRQVLDSLIEARSPARYSRADGQVYHDAAVRPAELDALLTREMAIAAIDQEFRFSSRMARRTMLEAALTEAHVLQQANVIQSQSAAPAVIRPPDDSPLAFLPPVLDYQLTAPTVFAELLAGFDDPNPLDDLDAGGPGPLVSAPLAAAREAVPLAGESAVASPRTMDREFWYLVFATYHEPAVARRMAANLAAASLTEFSDGARSCFAATFEAASIDVLPLLAGDLAGWVTAASPALGATTGPVSQTTVELRTCDPGETFTPTSRFGIARDLISWQAADLAVASAVTVSGGDQAAVAEALGRLSQSGSAMQVVALDPTVTATEMARIARVAAEPILAEAIVGGSGSGDVDG